VPSARRPAILAALLAIYLIWGSSYLAIKVALESLPPLTMAGARFVVAGVVLLAIARASGAAAPTAQHWLSGFAIGALLMLVGNGGVCWAQQRVPSGIAALLISTTPLWMTLLAWAQGASARPRMRTVAGLVTGFAGVGLLIVSSGQETGGRIDPAGAAVLLVSAASWAQGSLLSRRLPLPASAPSSTALQMGGGGALLLVVGLASGEGTHLDLAHASARSLAAVAYLTVVASIVAFTAYVWLLKVASPTLVSTYAYVNPVIAVALGWALAGEPLTPALASAAAVILCGVALIVTGEESARKN
jgi:drug/metabolite transporter (DMT)-like permease